MMKPEEALTMEKLLNELQSVDTVKLVLTGCGESIYDSREVYEAIRPFVEKQVAKKVESFNSLNETRCPGCRFVFGYSIELGEYDGEYYNYCVDCGQKLDWSVVT